MAETAARLRAEYSSFKAMDSLHLSAACHSGCDLFLTNDKQLTQIRSIECITIDEWNEKEGQ
ncbi:MAG: PIN domain-containing protein [Oscillospiraceae bacterium]|nr:PIN domain-containing protein [Oscillospiraceae bacterium]